jgi:oligopeptide/dipeptide ABC transporter ATP-binding protein
VADRVAVMYLGKLVEVGPAADLAKGPHHPYARALWTAARWTSGGPVAAAAPSARSLPAGCRFHPRCPACTERCRDLEPAPTRVGPDHVVSCFHPCDDEPAARGLDVSLPRR